MRSVFGNMELGMNISQKFILAHTHCHVCIRWSFHTTPIFSYLWKVSVKLWEESKSGWLFGFRNRTDIVNVSNLLRIYNKPIFLHDQGRDLTRDIKTAVVLWFHYHKGDRGHWDWGQGVLGLEALKYWIMVLCNSANLPVTYVLTFWLTAFITECPFEICKN